MTVPQSDPERPQLDHALPGRYVDAIRDGVPSNDARKVWAMCMTVAMSASLRGWTEQQYVDAVAGPHSKLWTQLMMRRDGRTSSMPRAYRELRKAWAAGVAKAADVDVRTREEIAVDAVERAYEWGDRLDARTDKLSPNEHALMTYVVQQTEERRMFSVACARRTVAAATGLGEEAVKGGFVRLVRKGLLVKYSPGRAWTKKEKERGQGGRAALYGLPPVPVAAGHPIDGGSLPMGCRGGQSETVEKAPTVDTGSRQAPQVPAAAETPHRETPAAQADGTPHRETPGLRTWLYEIADVLLAYGISVAAIPVDRWAEVAAQYSTGISSRVVADQLATEQTAA